ncbi:hypothetical protein PGIGA_G00135980 [Pangasianodon gigas]|uniref:Uncharacterized protein n=1 Tax=Pangasianodon gigas TaxID=30993 RepID=A0ACC5XJP7_PANGG|nr:hypothetical protein [Pangasianodon gigas]
MAVKDDELERRAVEELLKEANRGRARAETMGPAGWMKCPLGSTNKRFLLNTLRPCAAERRSGSRSAPARGAEDSREEGDRGSRHRPEDREHGYRKDTKHRRERPRSHSQSPRPRDSSTSELASTGHAPHHANQSKRTRSRSPIRERLANKRSTDRTRK